MLQHKNNRGFTLIELLVVIAIIGILSAVVLASLNSARQKGRDAKRVADIKQIQVANELRFDDLRSYSLTIAALVPTYLPAIPLDPLGGAYLYGVDVPLGPALDFVVGATLENASNPALNSDIDAATFGVTCADPVVCFSP